MLTQAVESHLAVRRAAGFALSCQGSYLKSFHAFSGARKQHYVSTDIAIEWAGLTPSVPQRARRLGIVIRFARYLRTEDMRHEVPPAVFGRDRRPRPTPYILTEKQIQQLVIAASRPDPKKQTAIVLELNRILQNRSKKAHAARVNRVPRQRSA